MSKEQNGRPKVYSATTRPMTNEDRDYLERVFRKEQEKHGRDAKCGGVDELGNYTALHYRGDEST